MKRATVADDFSRDYAEARARFLHACAAAGLEVESHRHPDVAPDGGALFTDVACAGPRDALAVLILNSGTHGVEGFCGSAVQTGLLREGLPARLAADQRAVVVHAINPYGFAHLRRANEDNVDLNRNFVDHSEPPPRNPDYDALAGAIAPRTYWAVASGASLLRLRLYQLRHGKAALRAAVTGGQYAHPQGLFYGGRTPAWSNTTFRAIVGEHVADGARVAFVDVHTGLGPYGHGEVISGGPPGAPEFQRALAWWGERSKSTKDGSSASSDVVGTMAGAVQAMLPRSEVTAVSLEFGTYPDLTVFRALQAENWLHHHGGPDHPRAARIQAAMRRVFYPDEDDWKAMVWHQANEIVEAALAGLAAQR